MFGADTEPVRKMKTSTSVTKKLLAWTMLAIIVVCVGVWWRTRDTLPARIRIATGAQGGLYYKLARLLSRTLADHTGREVEVIETLGSQQNRQLLLEGAADLAIMQSGSVDMRGLTVLTPLYAEPSLILVRHDSDIESVLQLSGRTVITGPVGSGMRSSAGRIVEHYELQINEPPAESTYFASLCDDPQLDAAIVTTGLLNPDLRALFATNDLRIVPIEDADALAMWHPSFQQMVVPRGFFSEQPPVPPQAVNTVATAAVLVARDDVSAELVVQSLKALYDGNIRQDIPTLIPASSAQSWEGYPLHPQARSYFQPYGNLGLLANFTEFLAGIKELIFALCAAGYLLYARAQTRRHQRQERELSAYREKLDSFLSETVVIEKKQMDTTKVDELEKFLDDITQIKLRALEELTHEDLRGDARFAIFLMQCANLIRKIQSKIMYHRVPVGGDK